MLTRYFWYKPFSSKKLECQQLQLLLQSFGFAGFIKIHLKLRKKPGVFSWKLPRILGSNLNHPSARWLRKCHQMVARGPHRGNRRSTYFPQQKLTKNPSKMLGLEDSFPCEMVPFQVTCWFFDGGYLRSMKSAKGMRLRILPKQNAPNRLKQPYQNKITN